VRQWRWGDAGELIGLVGDRDHRRQAGCGDECRETAGVKGADDVLKLRAEVKRHSRLSVAGVSTVMPKVRFAGTDSRSGAASAVAFIREAVDGRWRAMGDA
jgi:hypothetical protein